MSTQTEATMSDALPPARPSANGADATIPTLRLQIDAVDEALIQLVAERARLSKRIQAARISGGGTRVELGRERVILDAYRTGLGPDGAQLADSILRVCRGAR
jgi:chorismate mutase